MVARTTLVLVVALLLGLTSSQSEAVPVDLALSGIATQSSTFCCDRGVDGAASKAIDGNTDGNFFNGSVSHTAGEQNPFWRVDLGNTFELDSITLWDRTDCCGSRLTNFRVSVLDATLSAVFSQDFFPGGGTFSPSLDIALPANLAGQFVQVQLLGFHSEPWLQLAEVQVFQAESTNPVCDIQLNKTTFVNGDQVIAQVARLANPGPNPVPVEVKLWFEVPGSPPVPFLTVGADGSFVLSPGFNRDFGPLTLATVQASFPRGQYHFNCRLLHAVTGAPLAEDVNPFQLQ